MSHVPVLPTADQVRAIRIGALELLLQIEQSDVDVEPAFLDTLHKLAQNPVRDDLDLAKVFPKTRIVR